MAPRNPVCCSIKIQLRYAENFNYISSYFSLDFILRYFLWDYRKKKHKPYAIDWFLRWFIHCNTCIESWNKLKWADQDKKRNLIIFSNVYKKFWMFDKNRTPFIIILFITEILFVNHSHYFPWENSPKTSLSYLKGRRLIKKSNPDSDKTFLETFNNKKLFMLS